MRGSLDTPFAQRGASLGASLSSVGQSGSDGNGHAKLLTAVSDTLKRAQAWRPVQLLSRRVTRVSEAATDIAEAVAGDDGGGEGGSHRSADRRYHESSATSPPRRVMSLVPRRSSEAVDRSTSRGRDNASPTRSNSRRHGRSQHAVPVSTTRVQDGIKWVNLVRFINLAKLFRPCLLPRNRRRVRFGPQAAQRGRLMPSSGGEAGKPSCDVSTAGAGINTGSLAAAVRPVYIQVRQGRQLVWPSFEGMDYSCFCVLLVGGQILGTTQAVPLGQGGGVAGGWGGGGGTGGGNTNTVQWNEGFSLPRSCFEGVPDGRVVLEVYSTEPVGDDVLVGQAELLLGPMLAAEYPHPLAAVLYLQALDDETGQVEPGTCGELHVAAWVEAEMVNTAAHRPYSLPTAAPADLGEAGVVTSNLSAPCGSKSMPQVVHSPLGTLYEEPCVVAFKISVVGLVNLDYGLLLGTPQSGMSKRRVRLEAHRSTSNLRDPGDTRETRTSRDRDRERRSTQSSTGGKPSSSPGGGPNGHNIPFASASVTRGMGPYLDRLKRKQQQQRALRLVQNPRSLPDKSGGGAATVAVGCLPRLAFAFRRHNRRQLGGSRAAATAGAATDELIEEDEDATAPSGIGAAGIGVGGIADDKILSGDDGDDGSSLTLNPTLPLSGMTTQDQAAGPGQGQGVFCYFKVSVDKQSYKSRLRWLPAPMPPPPGLNPVEQLQFLLDAAASVELHPSVFVFTLTRPLSNVPVGLAMYVTSSARRRGRVVGRLTVQLYDLLDQVLGVATGGGLPLAQRPDMGVTGKKVELIQLFKEAELGAVRLIVQVADVDERAALFRLPLVSDPQQLVSEGALGPAGGCSFLSASMLLGKGARLSHGGGSGVGTGKPEPMRMLGPVLSDKELLRQVLKRSDVEPDVEDMFLTSYKRVGSLNASGGGALQARMLSFRRAGLDVSGGGGWQLGRNTSHADAVRIFKEALAAAATGTSISDADKAAGNPIPTASSSILAKLFRDLDGLAFSDRLSSLERSPRVSTASRAEIGGGGSRGSPAAAGAGFAPRALGSLVLRIASINTSGALAGNSYCCIVKCGPHWLRTVDWSSSSQDNGGMPQWQVVIPLYNPATILTVGIFTNSTKSVMGITFNDNLALVSRVRLKLSSVRPFRRSWHIVAMYMNGTTGPAAPGGMPLVGVLGLKMQYSSLTTLALSYFKPTAPESLYELDLEADMALKMEADARKISELWLASAQPPIPPEVAKLLLDDGRMTFQFTRTKNNWRRVKSGMRLLLSLNDWFKHICSWKSPQDSLEVVFCIALLCYLPTIACKLFFFMAALQGVKGFMHFLCRVRALVDSGAEAAASVLISPRAATGGGVEVRGDAATAAAAAAVAAAACGGTREAVGTMLDVTIGGGLVEAGSDDEAGEDSKVAVGTVAEFKRKFAELIELGLLLQNLFDDVASILERMQAILSFQDMMASCIAIVACVLLVGVVALLGFPTAVFLVLLWQVRPPSLRDALPPPPFIYFMKLPCKSAAEFG
ncbi:hypothetical protein VaNZ11_011636 [Volvox africanus]|uniref:Multiple C2 domain-containing protein n=1 Tax=Volvox africanus TaxID=51714 RepID=A0ABQ5SBY4_9CHLO|nr:hypothetical protein VaNZ11_011636 [Volvox africanus]